VKYSWRIIFRNWIIFEHCRSHNRYILRYPAFPYPAFSHLFSLAVFFFYFSLYKTIWKLYPIVCLCYIAKTFPECEKSKAPTQYLEKPQTEIRLSVCKMSNKPNTYSKDMLPALVTDSSEQTKKSGFELLLLLHYGKLHNVRHMVLMLWLISIHVDAHILIYLSEFGWFFSICTWVSACIWTLNSIKKLLLL